MFINTTLNPKEPELDKVASSLHQNTSQHYFSSMGWSGCFEVRCVNMVAILPLQNRLPSYPDLLHSLLSNYPGSLFFLKRSIDYALYHVLSLKSLIMAFKY